MLQTAPMTLDEVVAETQAVHTRGRQWSPQGAGCSLIASQAPRRMRSNANGGRGIGEHHNP